MRLFHPFVPDPNANNQCLDPSASGRGTLPRPKPLQRFPRRAPVISALIAASLWLGMLACGSISIFAESSPPSPQARSRRADGANLVFKERINPHWFENHKKFWYRNDLRGGSREFIVVDAEQGLRRPAFDHDKLAKALSSAAQESFAADRLPFTEIEFLEEGRAVRFQAAGKRWQCELENYVCKPLDPDKDSSAGKPAGADREPEAEPGARRGRSGRSGEPSRAVLSPNKQWTAFLKDHNVYVRTESDGKETAWSKDGEENNRYARLAWSPDSKFLVAWRLEPGDQKEVHLIRSSPPNGGRAVLESRPYALPGDKLNRFEPNIFEAATGRQFKPAVDRFEHGWESPRVHWSRDGSRCTWLQIDRGHQRLRVMEVELATGAARHIIDERSDTFIWTVHKENVHLDLVTWLEKTDELIHASERDGWRHLYLVDINQGAVKHQITRGAYVVRGVDFIDEENRQVWFHASGRHPDQDPYFVHYYRVNFDGSGLVALTEGNGTHTVQFSPDRRFLIDSWSRVDAAPRHELRRTSDGQRVCELEEADIAELRAAGWQPPEVFTAKGRDGKTDIWGIISTPRNLDRHKKYPVIEDIYAGPQGAYVPKSFSAARRYATLTDLGFVVVKIDGMGTAHRSKAFHDVCWKNLKDAGFPDRILWMKAAAAKYAFMDLDRVGVYGNSAGGQNAAAALLFHPEFYKVGVASCGCHDNRMDKASWNEQWMGYPVGPQYAECSNIDNAHRLKGRLLLIVGEMDTNVPPESTLRFADALIRADKDFDLIIIPNGGHGMGSYGQRRMHDFFVRHLPGQEIRSTEREERLSGAAAN
jgi:dipeptidyl aminopeptidase/acylaminoacyl peptidase